MKHFFTTAFLSFFFLNLTSFAQDNLSLKLKSFIDNGQYNKIIDEYALNYKDYSSDALYYIGLAYYMKEDNNNCLKFMNLTIDKDPEDTRAFYIKGSTLNYLKKYEEAIKSFQAAIALKPDDAQFYSGIGDAYYNSGKKEQALGGYKKAIQLANPPDRAFIRVAEIYAEQHQDAKSLEAYYVAKSKISEKSASYTNTLYNIGKFEAANKSYDKAEVSFAELILLSPKDYEVYEKLIQLYYAQKKYEKAIPLKDKLYKAFANGELKNTLGDRFCFDIFKWKNKTIVGYERFESKSKDPLFDKHLFFVMNADRITEFKILTEYSAISVEQSGPKYLLCMEKGNSHSTFNIGFNDNVNYDDLKKSVIDILEEKVKPSAISKPVNK